MASFFGRLKSGAAPASPAAGTVPVKKDPNAPEPTPLEKMLVNAGPIRGDGSDKFFGFENFGSTCYCNSVVQCLYYSAPFRNQVINFPTRSPPDALERPPQPPLAKLNTNLPNGQNGIASPAGRDSLSSPTARAVGKPATTPTAANGPAGNRPEDSKDSPEYKKKQALLAGPILQMDYENSKAYGMSESLFSSLKDIFEAVIANQSHTGIVSPYKLLEILRRDNEMFRTPMHQDAHEFLNLLLNEVVENVDHYSKSRLTEVGEPGENADTTVAAPGQSLATSNSNSGWVHDLFKGTLTSETRCLTCENTSQRDEAFLDLSVDLEQHSSVTSCLRKFSEEEMLCERNKFHCDNCGGLQEAEKRMKIKRLPRILALHLKRFKYTEDLQRLQKLFHRVVYPFYLRLFNTTDDAEDPDRLYELYAVVVHIGGGPYHGHYVSIIKTQDRGWLLFDDEMVEPVDKAYVRNFFGGEGVLACAYVLFYQETTEEAMMKEQEEEGLAAAEQATALNQAALTATGSKANGVNGHTALPQTPSTEEPDHFASLDHAATASALATIHSHPNHPTIEHTTTNVPTISARKSNLALFKKEPKEERERKAAEKELEKQAKQKRKEMEHTRRENYKRQEDDLRAALAASRQTKTEEDRKRVNGSSNTANGHENGNGNGITQPDQTPSSSPPPPPLSNTTTETETSSWYNAPKDIIGKKENGFNIKSAAGLSRFRHSSMSLRGKPKFWPGGRDKDKDKEKERKDTDVSEESSHAESEDRDRERGLEGPGVTSGGFGEKEGKNRFSLGRKKSTFKF